MNDYEKQFDEEFEGRVSGKLGEDLKAIFGPESGVPSEVDYAVVQRARQHFAGKRQRRWGYRWIYSSAAAAAAIIIVCVLLVNTVNEPMHKAVKHEMAANVMDIDNSGKVDILDAFILAKRIEIAKQNGLKWDFNKDGLVDKKDVDLVAVAAVRIDKGVL